MSTETLPVLTYTPAQGDAIIRNQYKYVWRIKYRDGEVVNQLTPDGDECKLDFIRPIAEASWVPTRSGLREASVVLLPGQQLVLARRTYQLLSGANFIASYLIGVEQLDKDGAMKRTVWFLSPPAEGLALRAESDEAGNQAQKRIALNFPGAVEKTEDSYADFLSAAQRWIRTEKPVVMA